MEIIWIYEGIYLKNLEIDLMKKSLSQGQSVDFE